MIILRSATPDDIDFIVQAENHPDNRLYIGQWNHEQHRQALLVHNYRYLLFQADGQPVGYAILADLDNLDDSVLLKRILVTQKGKGYGKTALQMIIQYVFRELYRLTGCGWTCGHSTRGQTSCTSRPGFVTKDYSRKPPGLIPTITT